MPESATEFSRWTEALRSSAANPMDAGDVARSAVKSDAGRGHATTQAHITVVGCGIARDAI